MITELDGYDKIRAFKSKTWHFARMSAGGTWFYCLCRGDVFAGDITFVNNEDVFTACKRCQTKAEKMKK